MTDRAQLDDVLRRASVLYLAMLDAGVPYQVPMNFGYDGRALYLHSAGEGLKIDLLRADPRVSFAAVVDDVVIPGEIGCKWSARYRSVLGRGTAAFVTDRAEKIRGLDAALDKFAEGPFAYDEATLARTTVIRIDITEMTGKQAGY
jgi:nitroimidazol reductase NimA-like FMN-containing flavoprotein (pyridoxamine 5'-phosphate oxidase superfamily)